MRRGGRISPEKRAAAVCFMEANVQEVRQPGGWGVAVGACRAKECRGPGVATLSCATNLGTELYGGGARGNASRAAEKVQCKEDGPRRCWLQQQGREGSGSRGGTGGDAGGTMLMRGSRDVGGVGGLCLAPVGGARLGDARGAQSQGLHEQEGDARLRGTACRRARGRGVAALLVARAAAGGAAAGRRGHDAAVVVLAVAWEDVRCSRASGGDAGAWARAR